jgi:DNA-3-methyladenine glycosylase I
MSLIQHPDGKARCWWPGTDPLYVAYHDDEWGVPETDDRALFEKLILDGFQAGLSWITILRKREAFRSAFAGFEPRHVVDFTDRDVERLMADPGIVRNRAKIEGTIKSARIWLDMMERESFARFLWAFVDGKPLQTRLEERAQVPAATKESTEMAKALKAKGWTFCGPTITFAVMQACGLVNDHLVGCYRHDEVAAMGQRVVL